MFNIVIIEILGRDMKINLTSLSLRKIVATIESELIEGKRYLRRVDKTINGYIIKIASEKGPTIELLIDI